LALAWTEPGFAASVLREFRQRLLTGQAALLLVETMLPRLREQGLLTAQGRQRPDAPHVLAARQTLHRLACVGETLRHALTGRATAAPAWRPSWGPARWCDRDSPRFADSRLPPERPARSALAEPIGTAGRQVLWAIYDPATPIWLRELPALQTRRQGWLQQCSALPHDQPMRWRRAADLPPAPGRIRSPDAPDAR